MRRLSAASRLLLASLALAAYPAMGERVTSEIALLQNPSTPPTSSQSSSSPQAQPGSPAATAPAKNNEQPGPSDGTLIDPQIITDAKAGNATAQYKLGYDYYLGHGIAQDYSQAAIWWRLAAEQGYADAQNNLGVLYNSGKGVPQSYAEAYFWQNLAAARSNGPRQSQFAKNRDESAARLSFFERLRVQKRASRWFNEHPVSNIKNDSSSASPSKPGESKPAEPSAPASGATQPGTKPDQPESKPAQPHASLA